MISSLTTTIVAGVVGAVVATAAAFGVVATQQSAGTSTNSETVSYDGS